MLFYNLLITLHYEVGSRSPYIELEWSCECFDLQSVAEVMLCDF